MNTLEDDGQRDRVYRKREREPEERARDPARTPSERSDYRALREYMLAANPVADHRKCEKLGDSPAARNILKELAFSH